MLDELLENIKKRLLIALVYNYVRLIKSHKEAVAVAWFSIMFLISKLKQATFLSQILNNTNVVV